MQPSFEVMIFFEIKALEVAFFDNRILRKKSLERG
jgi:hypothetical protein